MLSHGRAERRKGEGRGARGDGRGARPEGEARGARDEGRGLRLESCHDCKTRGATWGRGFACGKHASQA